MKRNAFTLIELLVVIAIIAILAAILFPVFAQAKLAAKKASSISNAKQEALAVLMYNNDNDDTFSWAQPGGWQWAEDWIMNTMPYMKSLQILLDPSDSAQRPAWSGPPFTYTGNGAVCWDWQYLQGWKVVGVFNARQSWWKNYQQSLTTTSVGLPAETIMTALRNKTTPTYDHEIRGAWDVNDVIFYGWLFDLPGSTSDNHWGKPKNSNGTVYAPYANNSVFSFVDGHTAAMNPMRTVKSDGYSTGNCDSGYFKMWDTTRTQ